MKTDWTGINKTLVTNALCIDASERRTGGGSALCIYARDGKRTTRPSAGRGNQGCGPALNVGFGVAHDARAQFVVAGNVLDHSVHFFVRPGFCFCVYFPFFFFSSRRRHTRSLCDWSSDVCSSDLLKI